MDQTLRCLVEHWEQQSMRIAPPAKEHEILAFERGNELRLDPAFRSYLLTVNGMLQSAESECDANLFAFWPLNRIRRAAEECPESLGGPEEKEFFVFADYMMWSWAYAIDLDSNSPTVGGVTLVGGHRRQCVASSFLEFVHLYIQDSPRVYAASA